MSPRSREFMQLAHERLGTAARELEPSPSAAVSAAYYAMLSAARAALSEEDLYAKTHKGVWDLFWRTFGEGERFDPNLADRARKTQPLREASDYDARPPSKDKARDVVELAGEFVAAIDTMLD